LRVFPSATHETNDAPPTSALHTAVFYNFPKKSFWAYCRGDAAIVYHEMFEMGSRLKDLLPLRDGDVVIDGGTNVGLFSLSVLEDESVKVRGCGHVGVLEL
jgi:hypothetical protein